jgi:hypothetical protein
MLAVRSPWTALRAQQPLSWLAHRLCLSVVEGCDRRGRQRCTADEDKG